MTLTMVLSPALIVRLIIIIVVILLSTPTESVGMGSMFGSVCLSVSWFVLYLQHNSKTNDPKVFKFGICNDLGISSKWYRLGAVRSQVKVTGSLGQ